MLNLVFASFPLWNGHTLLRHVCSHLSSTYLLFDNVCQSNQIICHSPDEPSVFYSILKFANTDYFFGCPPLHYFIWWNPTMPSSPLKLPSPPWSLFLIFPVSQKPLFQEAHSHVSAVERHSLYGLDLCTCYPFQKTICLEIRTRAPSTSMSLMALAQALLSVFTELSQVELF